MNVYFNNIKAILALEIKNLIALTLIIILDSIIKYFNLANIYDFFDFWNLDKFDLKKFNTSSSITLFFSAIFTNTSKFFNKLFIIFSIKISELAILLNL